MINSGTNLVCLLGSPVKQSFSPFIHNYLFKKYKINNIYTCFDVENIKDSINAIKTLNLVGCNITIPHKVDAIEFVDCVDFDAKLVGAINTIKNENKILKGYNTDGDGFVKSIKDNGYSLENKKVLVLGAGGASRSICVCLAKENIKSMVIQNRTLDKAKNLSDVIKNNFNVICSATNQKITKQNLENVDVLINTTSVGMNSNECLIDSSIKVSNKNLLVCDIVYKPFETSLIKWAKSNDLDVIYGIDMLINQAFEAFFIWTNIKPTKDDFDYIKHLYENQGDILSEK